MLKLTLEPKPYWLTLVGDVRVLVEPARSSFLEAVRDEIFDRAGDPEGDEAAVASTTTLDWAKAMARAAITEWEGLSDDAGDPLGEPTPEWIDALMEDDQCFRAFRDKYVFPALMVSEEGNA